MRDAEAHEYVVRFSFWACFQHAAGILLFGVLLFGVALLYGFAGGTSFPVIRSTLAGGPIPLTAQAGLLLILAGLGFKVAAVPFQFWAPDVYEGSPSIVSSFMSTVVKVSAIAAFYRLFADAFPAAGAW